MFSNYASCEDEERNAFLHSLVDQRNIMQLKLDIVITGGNRYSILID